MSQWVSAWLMVILAGVVTSCMAYRLPPEEEDRPHWSPDGQQLVYECYLEGPASRPGGILDRLNHPNADLTFYQPEAADLCMRDIAARDRIRLTDEAGGDWYPVWSPDGLWIAYFRADGVYLIGADGQDRRQLVAVEQLPGRLHWWLERAPVPLAWSPKGDYLLWSGCLESQDSDIYIIDVHTGEVTNLTPESRAADFAPTWTLGGSAIFYLSGEPSTAVGCELSEAVVPQMNVINSDGSGERVVYKPEFYFPPWQVSVSDSGRVLFVTDMASKTADDYFASDRIYTNLYVLDLFEGQAALLLQGERDNVLSPVWSPDEQYVAYLSSIVLEVFDIQKREVLKLRDPLFAEPGFVWSPNSRMIAATRSVRPDMALDTEEHIYLLDIQTGTHRRLISSSQPLEQGD